MGRNGSEGLTFSLHMERKAVFRKYTAIGTNWHFFLIGSSFLQEDEIEV